MPAEIREFFGAFLRRGACRIGQIQISPDFCLGHVEDSRCDQLEIFHDPHDAMAIARYDDRGKFRPLKTAPNLRHGWQLQLRSLEETALALDFLYPAALGTALALTKARLKEVNLRDTLARQTGMYAVTRKITDEQAQSTIVRTCNHQDGCLRHILWSISSGRPSSLSRSQREIQPEGNEIPLLCAEACNLLVAAARQTVKSPAE